MNIKEIAPTIKKAAAGVSTKAKISIVAVSLVTATAGTAIIVKDRNPEKTLEMKVEICEEIMAKRWDKKQRPSDREIKDCREIFDQNYQAEKIKNRAKRAQKNKSNQN